MNDKVKPIRPNIQTRTGEPQVGLAEALERLAVDARAGTLQSFIGTGFGTEGDVYSLWFADLDVYRTLGALAWLEHTYVNNVTEPQDDEGN